MPPNSSTCENISPLLDAYHDAELSATEQDIVASHLDSCQVCQGKLKSIESVVVSLKNLPRLQMAHDLASDSEFLQRALQDIARPDEVSSVVPGNALSNAPGPPQDQVGANIRPFPKTPRLLKKILPLPGPVIFASAAAAAALALVITVPRYLNNETTKAPSLATLPKQTIQSFDRNKHDQTKNVVLENKTAQGLASTAGMGPDMSKESISQQRTHIIAQTSGNLGTIDNNDNNNSHMDANRSAHDGTGLSTKQDQASELNGRKTELANVPDGQFLNPPTEEKDVPASVGTPEPTELLALYPGDPNTISDELAIPTDEDGLYALKL